MENIGIILASGKGSRFGESFPKQFFEIAGKSVLEHTIDAFEESKYIDSIILVIPAGFREHVKNILSKCNYKKINKVLDGGETRKDSVRIAIDSIEDEEANVLIHDGVRPFVSDDIISRCIEALEKHNAITVAIPVTDTIIKVNVEKNIENVIDRKNIYRCQTPQCFKLSLIRKAHELAAGDENFTDDCGIVLKYNLSDVYIVDGDENNIKITYKSDIYFAEKLFQIRNVAK